MELMAANEQWSKRPDDERYLSLTDMQQHFDAQRTRSKEGVVASKSLVIQPQGDNNGLTVNDFSPTNWAFGQLCQFAEAPAKYLRTMPAEIVADCINYGLQFKRNVEDVGVLMEKNGESMLRAMTGPSYGRIWNGEVTAGLIKQFGDGRTGDFRVPGEFGKAVEIDKQNTTLYASDRDMWVFLADEEHRIEVPSRRNGEAGQLARGFFVWNSEVGSATFGMATFLFDYVCCNRIVWGAAEYQEVRIRHTASAPTKFLEEITPALKTYANSSARSVVEAVAKARSELIATGNPEFRNEAVTKFLADRFGKHVAATAMKIHELEENRPVETLWDATVAITAYARGIKHQDVRVDLETRAGKLMA
jgi:hypothetical protein